MTIPENKIVQHILTVSKKLIAIPSTKENPEALQKALDIVKKEAEGYFPIEEFESNGIKSLLIHNTAKRTKHFKVILNGHLDVIPGTKEQYHAFEKDDKLYGRGSYDMKVAAATLLLLFKNLANELHYPIGLQIVTDEENGSLHGTKLQLTKGLRTDFAITGECGSNFGIINKAKGVFWFTLHAQGTSAHGAYLWRGDNALWKLFDVLEKLRKLFPIPSKEEWVTTLNLAKIETPNMNCNAVPDAAVAYLDMRITPEDKETVFQKINSAIPKDIRLVEYLNDAPQYASPDNPYLLALQKAGKKVTGKTLTLQSAHATSEIRHYNAIGCDGVEFGLVGAGQHENNEYVEIQSIEKYYHTLKTFLLSLNT